MELKPCPFCWGKDISIPRGNWYGWRCMDCGAIGFEDWNTRPLEDALQAKLSSVEAELRGFKEGTKEGAEILKAELRRVETERDTLQVKLEDILADLYAIDCDSMDDVSVSYAVAQLCDEKLDKSGELLGRVREKAYRKKQEA